MGRIIRRTVTITISESWTIVWTDDSAVDETSPSQTTTIVQDQPKPQEEEDETILPAVTTPDDVTAKPKVRSQGKRTRRRRVTGNQ